MISFRSEIWLTCDDPMCGNDRSTNPGHVTEASFDNLDVVGKVTMTRLKKAAKKVGWKIAAVGSRCSCPECAKRGE